MAEALGIQMSFFIPLIHNIKECLMKTFLLASDKQSPLIYHESGGRAKEAAMLLAETLKRITGKSPEVLSRGADGALPLCRPLVTIGYCYSETDEQIVKIETEDGIVRLSGNPPHKGAWEMGREAGWAERYIHLEDETADGAYYSTLLFIREYLGVEALFPGKEGYAFEKRKEIFIADDINYTYKPKLLLRKLRNSFSGRRRDAEGLEKIKVSPEIALGMEDASRKWFSENFLGYAADLRFTHNFTKYWDKYKNIHPEWFALQENGSRDQSRDASDRARICKSNEHLIKHIAGEIIDYFDRNPHSSSYSISLNDGGFHNRFCVCEKCQDLDASDAPEIKYGSRSMKVLSDRVFTFYSKIAEIVGRKYPEKLLGAYAYSAYNTPPLKLEKLPENLLLGIVRLNYMSEKSRQADLESIDQWSKKIKKFFVRPNALSAFYAFPSFYGHKLAEDVRYSIERGCLGFDWDCNAGHWSVNGVNLWILAQVMWDPDKSVDELLERYCRHGFGAAWRSILEYIYLTKRVSDEFAASEKWIDWTLSLPDLAEAYTDEWFDESESLLKKAIVESTDTAVKARIEFLKSGVSVSKLRKDYILSAVEKTGDEKPKFRIENEHLDGTSVAVMKGLDEKIAGKRDEIYRAVAGTYALNVGALAWRNL